jgi:hypothetical protein
MADTIVLTTHEGDTVTFTINGTTYITQAKPDALVNQDVMAPYTDIEFEPELGGTWIFGGQPFCYNENGIVVFTISNISTSGFRVHPVETAKFNASIWRT